MILRRFLQSGAVVLLAGFAIAGCSANAASTGSATPTATCPSTQAAQFKQATGTVTTVSSTQITVQTTNGAVVANLSSRTRVTRQQTVAPSVVQDGVRVQVIVKNNGDGTYTAQIVAIRQAAPTGSGNGGGTGSGNGGGRGGSGANPACRTGRGGAGSGPGAGNGGIFGSPTEGGIPTGDLSLAGTVSSTNGQTMTITTTNGADYTVKLDSTTVYSQIAAAKTSDLQANQAVLVIGQAQKDGSINALSITILLSLPASQ